MKRNNTEQTPTAHMIKTSERKSKRTGRSKLVLGIATFIVAIAAVMGTLYMNREPEITPEQARYQLLQEGIKQSYYNTELLLAANKGNATMVKMLLIAGANPNAAHKEWTPLMYAAYNGHRDCVRILCKSSAINVNKANNSGWTPLMMAAAGNHADCVQLLLKTRKIDIHSRQSNGNTALDIAKVNKATACAELLTKAMR